MSFDAGSVEGTLILDRDPFQRALKDARREAAEFERNKIKAILELTGLEKVRAALASFARNDIAIDAELKLSGMQKVRAEVDALDRKKVEIAVDLDRSIVSRLAAVSGAADKAGGSFSDVERKAISLNQGFDLISKSIGLLKWPSMIAGAGLAARALSVLLGGATALASAIGTGLAGAAVVGAQTYLALGQAFGVVKVALSGVTSQFGPAAVAQEKATAAAAQSAEQAKAQAAAQALVQAATAGLSNAQQVLQGTQQRLTNAEQGLTQAHQNLTAAQHTATQAQKTLAQARDQAARDIQGTVDAALKKLATDERAVGSAQHGVEAAQKSLSEARAQAAREIQVGINQALAGLKHAEGDVERANDSVRLSELDLVNARRQARQSIIDERLAAVGAAISYKQAQLDVMTATKHLQDVEADPKHTAADLMQARLDLRQAELNVKSSRVDSTRAQRDLETSEKQGVSGNPAVVAARKALHQAQGQVEQANHAAMMAQRALTQAESQSVDQSPAVVSARRALNAAQSDLTKAVERQQRAEERLRKAEAQHASDSPQVVAARRALQRAEDGVASAHDRVAVAQSRVAQASGQVTTAQGKVSAASERLKAAQAAEAHGALDVARAQSTVADTYKTLAPAAQAFVDQVKSMQARWLDLRQAVQQQLFEGVNKGLRAATQNFGVLKDAMTLTAGVLGDLAARFGKLVGSPEFGRLFARVTSENADILKRLGNAAIDLAPALLKILDAARPLTDWITKGIKGWAKTVAGMVDTQHASGGLATFFDKAKDSLKALVSIGGSLVTALFNIGKAARGPGQDLLNMLADAAKKFADWTGSTAGQNTLAKYFESIKPPLIEMGKLLRDVVKDFFSLGHGTDLTSLIHTLRVDLLPVLVDLLEGTSKAFGPKIIALLTQFGELMLKLAGSSGPLTLYVDGLTALAKVLNFIFDTMPGVKSATVDLIGAFLLYKTLAGPIGAVTAFTAALGESKLVMMAVNAADKAMVAAMGLYETAVIAAGSATRLAVASTGIGALVVAAVLIVTHWKEVKAFLADAWQFLKEKAIAVGKWVWDHDYIFGLAAAPLEIIKHWKDLRDFFVDVWGWMKQAAGNLADAIKDAAEKGFLGPVGLIITHWSDLKDTLGQIWHAIKDTAGDVWGGIKDAVLTPIRAAKDALSAVVGAMKDVALTAWRALRDTGSDVWGAIKDAVTVPIRAARDVLGEVVHAMKEVAGDVWRALRDTAKDVWGAIKDAITAPIRAAGDVLDKVWGGIKGAAKDAFDFLHDNIIDRFKGIAGKVEDIFQRVPQAMKSVMNAVIAAFNAAINSINDITPGDINVGPVHIPGLPDIPNIPRLAKGARNFAGGWALVGEEGPELRRDGPGPVVPADITELLRAIAGGMGNGGSTTHNWQIQPIAGGGSPDPDSLIAQLGMALRAQGGW